MTWLNFTETTMSDHDSTITNSKFKEILKGNEIFQTLNIKDDHHALELIDSFARTLKKRHLQEYF